MTPHLVSVAAGDTNLDVDERGALAAAAGAVLVDGHGVDCLFLIGARVVETHVLAVGGSDHPPVVYVLETPDGRRIVVLAWNVYVGQSPRRVRWRIRRLLKRWRPDVVMLSEAYRCRDQLAKLKGCHLVQGDNVGEGADCALLFPVRHRLVRAAVTPMTKRWIGPKHNEAKAPREFPHGRVHLAPGLALRGLALHIATGGTRGRNKDSVNESIDYATRWLERGHPR